MKINYKIKFVISFSHEKTENFKMNCWYIVICRKYYYSIVSN